MGSMQYASRYAGHSIVFGAVGDGHIEYMPDSSLQLYPRSLRAHSLMLEAFIIGQTIA